MWRYTIKTLTSMHLVVRIRTREIVQSNIHSLHWQIISSSSRHATKSPNINTTLNKQTSDWHVLLVLLGEKNMQVNCKHSTRDINQCSHLSEHWMCHQRRWALVWSRSTSLINSACSLSHRIYDEHLHARGLATSVYREVNRSQQPGNQTHWAPWNISPGCVPLSQRPL